jgi:hypothetical protein
LFGSDNTNFQAASGLVGVGPFDVNNNNFDIATVSFVSNNYVNRRLRVDAELRSAAGDTRSGCRSVQWLRRF